jgi:hypothetical protein
MTTSMVNSKINRNSSLKFLLVVLLRVKYKIWEEMNFIVINPFYNFNPVPGMMSEAWSGIPVALVTVEDWKI